MSRNKRTSRKVAEHKIAGSGCWVVKRGRLVPGRGRPANVIQNKKHEREVETMLIRSASPLPKFNDRKKYAPPSKSAISSIMRRDRIAKHFRWRGVVGQNSGRDLFVSFAGGIWFGAIEK